MEFTGNPDVDRHLLFSLPDSELRRFCSANKYFYQLCTAPESGTYWQERFRQRFPSVPVALAPGSEEWRRLYWQTRRQRRLPPEDILGMFTGGLPPGFCVISYLGGLSAQMYEAVDVLSQEQSCQLRQSSRSSVPYSASTTTFVRWLIQDIIKLLQASLSESHTPWAINSAVIRLSYIHELLPQITPQLPILVRIGGQQGTHYLTKEQFLGMMLYANYATAAEVAFYLQSCPLHYSAREIREILRVNEALTTTPVFYQLQMLNRDTFAPITPETMQPEARRSAPRLYYSSSLAGPELPVSLRLPESVVKTL